MRLNAPRQELLSVLELTSSAVLSATTLLPSVPSSANFSELNIGVRMRLSRNMVAKLPKPT